MLLRVGLGGGHCGRHSLRHVHRRHVVVGGHLDALLLLHHHSGRVPPAPRPAPLGRRHVGVHVWSPGHHTLLAHLHAHTDRPHVGHGRPAALGLVGCCIGHHRVSGHARPRGHGAHLLGHGTAPCIHCPRPLAPSRVWPLL